MKWNRSEGLLSAYFDCFENASGEEPFGNWELDIIGKRARCINLPPITRKKTVEEEQLPKNSNLRKLLDSIAPDRHNHKHTLTLLSQVSDATRPTITEHELLSRLRAAEGRPNILNFDHTLFNEYVFEIRRNQKLLKKSTSERVLKKVPSAVNVNLVSKGKFGVKNSLLPLKKVEWDNSIKLPRKKRKKGQKVPVPSPSKKMGKVKIEKVTKARNAFLSSSNNSSLQCVVLKQIQPHVFRANQNQKAQQFCWLTFLKLSQMPLKTQEQLLEERLKRIFRSKTETLVIKVQRKWRANHRKKCSELLHEADLLKKHFWRILITLRCRYRLRMARTIRAFCRDYAKTSNRFAIVIKKTRYRIIVCQRYIRAFLRCKRARMFALRKLWDKRLGRKMVPCKKAVLKHHQRLLAQAKWKQELEEQLAKKLKMEMEEERRRREEAVVQHVDMALYAKPGVKPAEKEVKERERWQERKDNHQLMVKYNNRINRMRKMIHGFASLERSDQTRSKEDTQKALDILAGRRFARFKRLTAEEKEAQARELQQTPVEKIHRYFQLYKIPHNIVHMYIHWLYRKFRRWHVHVSKHNIKSDQTFSITDIKHLFFDGGDEEEEEEEGEALGSGMQERTETQSGNKESYVAKKERELAERQKWPMLRICSLLNEDRMAALAVNLGVASLVHGVEILGQMTQVEIDVVFEDMLLTLSHHKRKVVSSTVDFDVARGDQTGSTKRDVQVRNTDVNFPTVLDSMEVLKQAPTSPPAPKRGRPEVTMYTPAETNPQAHSRLAFSRPSTTATSVARLSKRPGTGVSSRVTFA